MLSTKSINFKSRDESNVLVYAKQNSTDRKPATIPEQNACYFKTHDEVINWKHLPRCWSFVRGIHRSPVNSPNKGQWHGVFMFSFICAWTNGRVNNWGAGDLIRHRAHYAVTVKKFEIKYAMKITKHVNWYTRSVIVSKSDLLNII